MQVDLKMSPLTRVYEPLEERERTFGTKEEPCEETTPVERELSKGEREETTSAIDVNRLYDLYLQSDLLSLVRLLSRDSANHNALKKLPSLYKRLLLELTLKQMLNILEPDKDSMMFYMNQAKIKIIQALVPLYPMQALEIAQGMAHSVVEQSWHDTACLEIIKAQVQPQQAIRIIEDYIQRDDYKALAFVELFKQNPKQANEYLNQALELAERIGRDKELKKRKDVIIKAVIKEFAIFDPERAVELTTTHLNADSKEEVLTSIAEVQAPINPNFALNILSLLKNMGSHVFVIQTIITAQAKSNPEFVLKIIEGRYIPIERKGLKIKAFVELAKHHPKQADEYLNQALNDIRKEKSVFGRIFLGVTHRNPYDGNYDLVQIAALQARTNLGEGLKTVKSLIDSSYRDEALLAIVEEISDPEIIKSLIDQIKNCAKKAYASKELAKYDPELADEYIKQILPLTRDILDVADKEVVISCAFQMLAIKDPEKARNLLVSAGCLRRSTFLKLIEIQAIENPSLALATIDAMEQARSMSIDFACKGSGLINIAKTIKDPQEANEIWCRAIFYAIKAPSIDLLGEIALMLQIN